MTTFETRPFAAPPGPDALFASEQSDSGLHFAVAKTMDDVLEAWQVLYRVYLRAGFIAPNPFELHTTPEAIHDGTLIILAKIQGLTVGTISAINDSPLGLPLDSVYHDQLQELRARGKTLIEVGLFGDRREDIDRSFIAVLELMRFTFWFGRHDGRSDFVCGIPPRRSRLYARAFGFDIIGNPTSYSSVQNNPVVLLCSHTDTAVANANKHKAIDYFLQHPLGPEVFESRFRFRPEDIRGTRLGQYLQYKNEQQGVHA